MLPDFTRFEQVVAYLLKAEHNVTLDCIIDGKKRSSQFDGLIEEHLENPNIRIRIGIECKKWKIRVPWKEVAAFSEKLRHCKVDKGIMISFSGFQSGALEEARDSNIALFEFRPCREDDFRKGTKIVNFDRIGTGQWHVKAELSSKTPLENEEDELSVISIYEVELLDGKGESMGKLGKLVSDMIDREMIYNGRKEGNLRIDWSDKGIHFRLKGNNKRIEITELEVDYELPIKEIKTLIPENWFIMKNVLDNTKRIIMASKVKEVESLFD